MALNNLVPKDRTAFVIKRRGDKGPRIPGGISRATRHRGSGSQMEMTSQIRRGTPLWQTLEHAPTPDTVIVGEGLASITLAAKGYSYSMTAGNLSKQASFNIVVIQTHPLSYQKAQTTGCSWLLAPGSWLLLLL